jgi:hypothetical protein
MSTRRACQRVTNDQRIGPSARPSSAEWPPTTVVDIDRTNELVFRAIAEGRGMTLECRQDEAGLHLVVAR